MQNIQNRQQTDRKILISFIIPVYNIPADMLHECIESILALSLRSYEREIIIVDDGSDVPAINFLNDFLNEIVYIRQRNGGLSKARNRGLQNATGKYIQFVDGDDTLLSNMYEHWLDIARFQEPDIVTFEFCRKKVEQKP
ncbi:MAG: glycosyltransferase, partial [Prevotella sp.]|nr:glycosyltransferase [Prevotella sp.]